MPPKIETFDQMTAAVESFDEMIGNAPGGVEPQMGTGTATLEQDVRDILPDVFSGPLLTKEQIRRQLEGPGKDLLAIQDATGAGMGDTINQYGKIMATPEAWGVKTEKEALDLVQFRAGLQGKRRLGDDLADETTMTVLSVLPFSPIHKWQEKQYVAAKRMFLTGQYGDARLPGEYVMVGEGLTPDLNVAGEELKEVIREYEVRQARGATIPAQVGGGVAVLPGYIGEFYAGGVLMKSLGLAATVPTKVRDVVSVAKAVGRALTRAGITTAIQPHRVTGALADMEISGESGMSAVAKAYGSVYIENLTELTGEGFNIVGRGIIDQLPMGAKIFNRVMKEAAKLGIDEASFMGRIARKGGWNGLLGEIGEERLNTILYGVFSIDDFGAGPDSTIRERVSAGLEQDLEAQNMLVESLILLTPGGVKILTKQASRLYGSHPEIEQAMSVLQRAVDEDQASQQAELRRTEAPSAEQPSAAKPAESAPVVAPGVQEVTSVEQAPQEVGQVPAVEGEARQTRTEYQHFTEMLLDERVRLLDEALDFQEQIGPVALKKDYEPRIREIDRDLQARGYKTDRLPSYDAFMESQEMQTALREEAQQRLDMRREDVLRRAAQEEGQAETVVAPVVPEQAGAESVATKLKPIETNSNEVAIRTDTDGNQPWNMTRAQFRDWDTQDKLTQSRQSFELAKQRIDAYWNPEEQLPVGVSKVQDFLVKTSSKRFSKLPPDQQSMLSDYNTALNASRGGNPPDARIQDRIHARLVQSAIEEGKPVPASVLEEYKTEPWAKEALAKIGQATQEPGTAQPGVRPKELTEPYGILKYPIAALSDAELAERLPKASPYHRWYQMETDFRKREAEGQKETRTKATVEPGPITSEKPPTQVPPGVAEQAQGDPIPGISSRQADLREFRRMMGLDGIPSKEKATKAGWLQEAIEAGLHQQAEDIATRVLANPYSITPQERMGMTYRVWLLDKEARTLRQQIKTGTVAEQQDAAAMLEQIQRQSDLITRALHGAGSAWGSSGASIQNTLDDEGNLDNNLTRARINNGDKPIPKNIQDKLTELTTQLVDVTDKLRKVENELQAKKARTLMNESASRKYSKMSAEQKDAELTQLKQTVTALLEAGC